MAALVSPIDPTRYEGGLSLKGPLGTATARVDISARSGWIHVTVGLQTARGAGQVTVDLTEDEAAELIGALEMARAAVRAWEQRATHRDLEGK